MFFVLIHKKTFIILLFLILAVLLLVFSFSSIFNHFEKESILVTSSSTIPTMQEYLDSLFISSEKIAYLTFDDGPIKGVTDQIVNILDNLNVKATFFVVGKHVKTNPDIIQKIFASGHYIANHTYSHDNNLIYLSEESFKNEIINTDIEIANALNLPSYNSKIFRYPNGFSSQIFRSKKDESLNILHDLGYGYLDWNSLNKDSEIKLSNSELLNNLKETSKDKGSLVILMHDTHDVNTTANILEESILYLKNQGYVFKTLLDY